MKSITLIFLFYSHNIFCQTIEYNVFLKDPCSSDLIYGINNFHLEKDGEIYKSNSLNNNMISLPTLGKYRLIIEERGPGAVNETYNILVKNNITTDTIIMSRIQEFSVTHDKHNYRFQKCGKLCHGIEKDYYSNGSIRVEGEFRKGLVIGELKKYHPNGQLSEISVYNKRGFRLKTTKYDYKGNVLFLIENK